MSPHPTDEELREALARRVQSARLSESERSDILRAARLRATSPKPRSLWTPAAGWLAAAAGAVVLALVMAPILLSPPGSATDGPAASTSPDPSGRVIDPVIFTVQNGTTLAIEAYLNDVRVATVEPGTTSEIDPSPLSDAPWHVEARTTGGRVLVAIDARPGDVWRIEGEDWVELHGVGARADLSCGRLDVWAGSPLDGPAPPESFPPGDCDIGTPAPFETEPPSTDCMAALITGRLIYEAATGFSLLASDGGTVSVIWPDGYGTAQLDGRYALVDSTGTALAFDGDLIELGGGYSIDGSWLPCGSVTIIEPAPSPLSRALTDNEPLQFGDRVQANGVVKGSSGEGYRICHEGPSVLLPGPPTTPECHPDPSVPVIGMAVGDLPGWTHVVDGGRSAYVLVEGIWTADGLLIEDARPALPDDRWSTPEAPCAPPPGGWPGDVPQSIQGEEVVLAVQGLVEAEPNRYAGFWGALLDLNNSSAGRALVVATVDDLETARAEIETIFPYNLCVIQVEYSSAELSQIEEALGPGTIGWEVSVEDRDNRVVVRVPFVDDAARARVAAYGDAVIFDALVVKITD